MNNRRKFIYIEFIMLGLITLLNINIIKKNNNDIKKSTIEFEAENSDIVNLYKQYVKKISDYYSSGYDNPIDIYNEFGFMYRNGLLSYGNQLFRIGEPVVDIHPYGGIDVVNGIGCCRNVNCLFTDVLKELGYDCGNMYGTLNNKNEFDIFANHVATWINIDGNIYILDPYNNIILNQESFIFSDDKNYFVPSLMLNSRHDEEYDFDMLLGKSIEMEKPQYILTGKKFEKIIEFETKELEEIEKQMVLKINNTLQK